MDTPYPSALPLYKAMCAWGDQQIVSEMLELEGWSGSPFWFFDDSVHDRKKGRYLDLREELERWFVDRLRAGEFVAWGYEEDRPLAGMKRIQSDLWRILEAQFKESSATAGTKKLIGIVAAPREGPLLAPQVRLVIDLKTEEIWLDGKPVRLTSRARALLIILAKAAHEGAGPMPSREIQPCLPNSKSANAVGHAAYALRQQLAQHSGHSAAELVQNQSGRGYFLQMQPAEIQMRL